MLISIKISFLKMFWNITSRKRTVDGRGRRRSQMPSVAGFEELERRAMLSGGPVVSSIVLVGTSPTNESSVSFTATFSEAVTGVDPTDFKVVTTGTVGELLTQVTPVSSSVYTVTVSGITGNGTLGLNLVDDDSIKDGSNIPLGGVGVGNGNFTGPVDTIDTIDPFVQSIDRTIPAGAQAGDGSVTFTATFSEAVTGVDSTDFQVLNTGTTAETLTVVAPVTPSVYTVTVSGITGAGTLGLNLVDNGSIHDLAGNPLVQQGFPVTFANPATLNQSGGANSMVLGDVNGDGRPDLITTSNGSVSVFLGNGDGTFQAPQTYLTVSYPRSVTISDVNGDGKPDIVLVGAVNSTTDDVAVLLGNGDGTFKAQQTSASGSYSIAMAVADLNGDGKPDIVVSNYSSDTVSVLLGNGNGTFKAPQPLAVGLGPYNVKIGDLNGDGKPDIVVGNFRSANVSVLLGNGNGTFQPQQTFATGTYPRAVVLGDVNGDGKPDIIVGDGGTEAVSVLLGNGDGTFQMQQTFAAGFYPTSLVLGDVNGDGKPDLVASNGTSASILLGDGDGTFQAQQTFNTGGYSSFVTLGDLNGDGRPDIVVASNSYYSATVSILLANGDGNFTGQVYNIVAVPLVTTPTATNLTATTETLGGNVTSDDGNPITERGVVYSLTSVNANPQIGGSGVTKLTVSGTTGVFNTVVSGLTAGLYYSFAAYATNSAGTTYTSPVTAFTTLAVVPSITTPTSISITNASATLGGDVTSDGGSTITERGVVYAKTSVNASPQIGGTGVTQITASGTTGIFTANIGGLTAVTGYSFVAYATNSLGTTYTSPVSTFTTTSTPAFAPTITTPTSTSVTTTSATLGGNVTSDGGATITARGVVYALTSVNANPQIGGVGVTNVTTSGTTGVFSLNASSLLANSSYSFVAYASNSVGTTYTSPVSTFTTATAAPTVIAPTSASITSNSAVLGGDVTSDGGRPVVERGVVYALTSVNPNPQNGGTGVTTVTASGTTGIFTANASGLVPGATYSFVAFAANSVGTTYTSPVSTFTALTTAPTVTTPTCGNVSSHSATIGGNVASDGGSTVTQRGVVYALTSVNPSPLIGGAGVTNVTTSGTTGPFTVNLSSLAPGAGYSFLAYATNALGTTYTSPVSTFATPAAAPVVTTPTSASITGTSAILGGNVTSDGGLPITQRGVVYALTSVNANPTIGGSGVVNVTVTGTTGIFTVSVSNLLPNSSYAFVAYATNTDGTTYTAPVSRFTTPTVAASVISLTPAGITSTTASLGGNVTSDGGSAITGRGIVYSLTSVNANPIIGGTGVTNVTATGTTGAFSVNVTSLSSGVGYSFVAYVTNGIGTTYSSPVSTFATLSNHAPVGTSNTITTLENLAYAFKASDFGFSDPNDNPPNSLLAVKITTVPLRGSLTDNGTVVTAGQFVSATDIAGGKLVFTPVIYASGISYASFTFQVQDNGGTTGGGVDTDPSAKTMKINVTPVNQAPVGTSGTVTAIENTPYTFKAADFGFTDPNDNPPNTLLAVKLTLLPNAGTFSDNGVAVSVNQLVSVSDISAGKLVFTPHANLAELLFLCKFQVEDNGGTANGGVNLDPNAKVLDVNILKVNHAPIGTSGAVTAAENIAYTFKTADFGFTDPNDTPANTLLAVKFTQLPTVGTLTDNGVAVTVNQFVSASDISSGKLVFTPAANLTGGPFFLCNFQVEDNGGTANGGVNLDLTPKVLDVNVVKPNQAPVGTSAILTGAENQAYTLKTADFGFTDPNDNPANTLLAVKFVLLPTLGTLTDNGVAVTVNQFVSAADISAGKLIFTPKANISGGPYFLCKFQVEDNGGTANGGANLDPNPKVLDIRLTS